MSILAYNGGCVVGKLKNKLRKKNEQTNKVKQFR